MAVRKLGERASVKMLLPMILMFGVVLIILMAVLYVFKLFSSKKSKQAVQAPENKTALPSAGAQDDEETIVAVATAAIAASRGESECAFRVISVRKLS